MVKDKGEGLSSLCRRKRYILEEDIDHWQSVIEEKVICKTKQNNGRS